MGFDRLNELLQRIKSYPMYEITIELVILWILVYLILRFLRGTRGARVIKGVGLILVLATLGIQVLVGENSFERLHFLYKNFLTFAALALVIVFQPELRRALSRLGEASLFRSGSGLRKARVIEEVLGAVTYLSKNKIGALIALERQVGLRGLVEAGTRVDSAVTHQLLNTVFWPGSALHDMGVVIRGDRLMAAGVQFPLAEGDQYSSELGSRHRAAIGLSQESDALVVVVSEETGKIGLAERGVLERGLTTDWLRSRLARGLGQVKLTLEQSTNETQDESDRSA